MSSPIAHAYRSFGLEHVRLVKLDLSYMGLCCRSACWESTFPLDNHPISAELLGLDSSGVGLVGCIHIFRVW